MSILIWILLIGGMASLLVILMADREQRKIGRQFGELFLEVDRKYEDFVENRVNLAVLRQENPEMSIEEISQKAYLILKPEINGLMAYVHAINYASVPIPYHSKYFKGAISLCSAYLRKKDKQNLSALASEDEAKFHESFQDAIIADMTQRMLSLKTGNYLD